VGQIRSVQRLSYFVTAIICAGDHCQNPLYAAVFLLQQVLQCACLFTSRQRSGKFAPLQHFAHDCLDRSIAVALTCMLLYFVCVVCCAYQFSPFDSVKYNETGTPRCTYDAGCTTKVGSERVDPCTADDVRYDRQGTAIQTFS
jgi:hypothetical protein